MQHNTIEHAIDYCDYLLFLLNINVCEIQHFGSTLTGYVLTGASHAFFQCKIHFVILNIGGPVHIGDVAVVTTAAMKQ